MTCTPPRRMALARRDFRPVSILPVLLKVFPQGFDQRGSDKTSRLREAYEDWLELGAKRPAVHHAWILHVLTELLEYPPEFLVEGQAIPARNGSRDETSARRSGPSLY